ncbi:hypothetical protein TWF730_001874 [Orbilia blumenaviensis]|uniref:Fork-head domain-containing protein n=1 Tax=Orbilia blumenaviensis TaxID=1796055 RepID=A0AAV9UCB2_9PEZI
MSGSPRTYPETAGGAMAPTPARGQRHTSGIAPLAIRPKASCSSSYIPKNYYKHPASQLYIPHEMHPTSFPAPPTILPSQQQQQQQKAIYSSSCPSTSSSNSSLLSSSSATSHCSQQSLESHSVDDTSSPPPNMVWEQTHMPSSASETLYLPQMPSCNKGLTSHILSMMAGVSPPLGSTGLHSSSYFTPQHEDIDFDPSPYARSNSMPLFSHVTAAPGYGSDLDVEFPVQHQMGNISPNYLPSTGQWTPPPHEISSEFYGQSVVDPNMMPGTPPGSAIYENELKGLNLINEPYYPQQSTVDDVPPYAEIIYDALMSAPEHKMNLQDIYKYFRDNYEKFRSDSRKGWMNSIRHNLSMNGAFVKIERAASDPGKGYMWLLAPAAVAGGVLSTTRYRKQGTALERGNMDADTSYSCYSVPKRNRTSASKRAQTKARRTRITARKTLQHEQNVNQLQQQPESPYPDFDCAMVHTPISIDISPMTPDHDFSSYHSESFSETLSLSSRHATPAIRPTEWQSPTSAHGHTSPYYVQSDDGLATYDAQLGNCKFGVYNHPYDGDFEERCS